MVFAGLCQRLGFAVAARANVRDVAGKVTDEVAAGTQLGKLISVSESLV